MIEKDIDILNNQLYTFDQFNTLLIDTIISVVYKDTACIYMTLKADDQPIYNFGIQGKGTPDQQYKVDINARFKVSIFIWNTPKSKQVEHDILENLIKTFWHVTLCDPEVGIISFKNPDTEAVIDNTIKSWRKTQRILSCTNIKILTTDKNSTDMFAILCFLLSTFTKTGIIINVSEFEYDIIALIDEENEIVREEHLICQGIQKYIGEDTKLKVGATLLSPGNYSSYSNIHTLAQKVCEKNPFSIPLTNIMFRVDNGIDEPETGFNSAKLALLRCINNVNKKDVFHNLYLDYISYYVAHFKINKAGDDIVELRNRLYELIRYIHFNNSEVASFRSSCESISTDSSIKVSNFEIALSILKGILANPFSFEKQVTLSIAETITVSVESMHVFITNEVENIEKLNWNCEKNVFFKDDIFSRDTILIRSSTEDFNIPKDIFFDVIVVDGRPSLGGALPDFWAAPLSQLITAMEVNANFKTILLWGSMDYINEIHYLLSNIKKWRNYDEAGIRTDKYAEESKIDNQLSIEYISHKTFQGYEKVSKFKRKFADNLKPLQDANELFDFLYSNSNPLSRIETSPIVSYANRIINRELKYDSIKLDIIDGIRTTDLSVAFPTVIEIIRNQYHRDEDINAYLDRSGRMLYELDNFKIVLLNPLNEQLPEYYKYDEQNLKKYYEKSFGTPDALFRSKMEDNNQFTHALLYIKSCLEKRDYAARRAIIVIPNDNHSEKDYSPLGLVSIQIAPRRKVESIVVDISYTWRTVEALVGLPYSLYGSIEFSKFLCEEINALFKQNDMIKIQLGKITYNAYSLHMFLDQETKNIARGIVNEATR